VSLRPAAPLALLVASATGCATWSNEQLAVAYHAANAADAGMTLARDRAGMYEGNPIAGSDPSDARVVGLALLISGAYELVCHHAGDEEKTCRVAFLWVKLATDAWNAGQLAKGCE
jgi:hypothetical protein